jgi:hypothetical protein
VFVLAGNVFHFQIKLIVRRHGYPVSFFSGHFRDVRYFTRIIQHEKNLRRKQRYKQLLYAFYISLALFVAGGLLIFSTLQ